MWAESSRNDSRGNCGYRMRKDAMRGKRSRLRGFTLVASLLLLLLMTGISIGLMMMVQTEGRAGNNDIENSLAYRGAEGAIENMTSSLAGAFQNIQSPQASDITSLSAQAPKIPGITFPAYTLTPRSNPNGGLKSTYGLIGSGSNQGLYAQILPIDLAVTAQRPLGAQVRMFRTVEVALVPVFQFGVFSESDLSFFSSPQLDFAGRVHTNGDLYLGVSSNATLTFHDKITVYGNVVRNQLPNGLSPSSSYNNDGPVKIVTASGGCDGSATACRAIAINEGSVVGGPNSAQNSSWPTISKSSYNGWVSDGNYGNPGGTGAKALTLPFVGGGAQPYEIIRRPIAGESTAVGGSRLANQAQIRVLLGDTQAGVHLPDYNGDNTQDIELVSQIPVTLTPVSTGGWAQNGVMMNGNTYYFGEANTDCTLGKGCDANFIVPPKIGGATFPSGVKEWPQIDGWLRVEVQDLNSTVWRPVTKEWLGLGFARGLAVPASVAANTLTDHRNAILYFQLQADRNGDGALTTSGDISTSVAGAKSQYNWFPINMYDAREGEVRDWPSGGAPGGASTCSVNGVMNAVELDTGNLRQWLKGTIGSTGNAVDYVSQNGYILYFSDRRGMLPDPLAAPPSVNGSYGFEDVINSSSDNGTPDGVAETPVTIHGVSRSPEDLDNDGRLDQYGATNVGDGFGINTNNNPPDPFSNRIASCFTTGRKNRVTGARHVLKLVDGAGNGVGGNLPVRLVANADGTLGGFTVASENPVYIQGNYNSYSGDPTWASATAAEPAHSAAAVIADTVTLLSNQWQDAGISGSGNNLGSLLHPTDAIKYRPAVTTYYRVAIAAGKTINFPRPSGSNSTTYFGTDGGLHNFLRFLEDWSNDTLYYKGSLVSLFFSTYNTGTFKCCNYVVYQPPNRNYRFDQLFTQPSNLPPGTPMFRDVNNLSYRQDFTPY
jgi:type II secretory pathway pseudopilin PulG